MIFSLWDAVRRRRAAREPMPEAWREILRQRTPFYVKLDAETRQRFEHKLTVFARTKSFEGAGGLELTEEMRVVISAAAARLVTNLPDEHYERLFSVVVYPGHYKHESESDHVVLGEANDRGIVVLSWEAVLRGLADPTDGHDTAIHEFAHALDIEGGAFDGTPDLEGDAYAPWTRVMTDAFTRLRARPTRHATRRGRWGRSTAKGRPVLRDYGAINPAEFFAVATEAFFERPQHLKHKYPGVYRQLAAYFRTDPAA